MTAQDASGAGFSEQTRKGHSVTGLLEKQSFLGPLNREAPITTNQIGIQGQMTMSWSFSVLRLRRMKAIKNHPKETVKKRPWEAHPRE